jgi:predicted Zn finger-like uncharacterized protein
VIIQCPYCATSYQLEPARLAGKSPMLKCSRCDHIFPAPAAKSKKRPTPPLSVAEDAAPAADKNLTLPFHEAAWKEDAEPADSEDLKVAEPEEAQFTLGDEDKSEEFALPEETPEPDAPALMKPSTPTSREEDDETSWSDEDTAEEPRRRESNLVVPLLAFAGIVAAMYFVFASALVSSPALRNRVLGRVPFIGSLGADRLMTRKVALSDVVGNYQRIKDGKEVFVITGKALNTAPVGLYSVQIAGKLYASDGRALDEKVIYCGNVISAKVLRDLTPRELSVLQKLNPPKRFTIEPGEASTFVIVFMDPPRGAAEFAVRVVAAEHQA